MVLIEGACASSEELLPVVWESILAQAPLSFFNTVLVSLQGSFPRSRVEMTDELKRQSRSINGSFFFGYRSPEVLEGSSAMDVLWLTGTVRS